MRRVAARLVPKELNFVQKQYREQVSLDMLDCANSDPPFMERIITGESELRRKGESKPKQSRQSRSKVKVMLIVSYIFVVR